MPARMTAGRTRASYSKADLPKAERKVSKARHVELKGLGRGVACFENSGVFEPTKWPMRRTRS